MVRSVRPQYAGAYYHITDRGDRKETVFTCDTDRVSCLQLLNSTAESRRWHVVAYCLMDNHYHLMLETTAPNLAAGMARLNGVYTQRFNRVYGRVGHVFQGRYKSQVIQTERHLLEACRYVVLNPVRAGLVNDPADWKWSSYCASAGLAGALSCLDEAWVRERVVETGSFEAYIDWIHEGAGESCDFLHPQPSSEIRSHRIPPEMPLMPDQTVPPLANILSGCIWIRGGNEVLRARIRKALDVGYSQRVIARELGVSHVVITRFSSGVNR